MLLLLIIYVYDIQEVPIVAFQNDEALAIALHLEEMGDDFQNLSMEEAPRWVILITLFSLN